MYQEHSLENGLRIFMTPAHSFQSVSVGIFVGVGSRYEDDNMAGASHFIEHMLFKGTSQRPTSRIIAEAIEGIGGISNAYTSQENTVYYAKVAAHQLDTAVDVLVDMVRNPLFNPNEFEKERQIIGEEINMAYDSPEDWVTILLDEIIWPDHPLGRSIAGTAKSLAGISREGLISFYQDSYHPKNLLIAIGGSFDPDEVVPKLEALLGDWQPATRPEYKKANGITQSKARWHVQNRPIEQGHICLAIPAFSRTHPDRYALNLLNTILGDGMSSRLFLNIREERGLTYAIDSDLNLLHDTGYLNIYAGVNPQRAEEALQAILDELHKLCAEPVPTKELNKAREYIKGRLVLSLEDSFSQAAWIAHQAMFHNTIKSPEEILQVYDTLTAADVQAVARKLITPESYNLAVIGPFEQGEMLGRIL